MIMLMMSYVYGEDAETDEMRASALLADSASDTGVHYGLHDDDDDVVVVDDVDHDGDGDGDEWMQRMQRQMRAQTLLADSVTQ